MSNKDVPRGQNVGSPSMPGISDLALVDGNQLFREGLANILKISSFRVVLSNATLGETLCQIGARPVDLLLLSLGVSQDLEAMLAEIGGIRGSDCTPKVVLLLPRCSASDLETALLSGVSGVIINDITGERLIGALDLVMHGQNVLPLEPVLELFGPLGRGAARPLVAPFPPTTVIQIRRIEEVRSIPSTRNPGLSERERQILRCLIEGSGNKLIARQLCIAEATVKVHIKGLLRKINVNNRTQAAIWALNNSMTTGPVGAADAPGDPRKPPEPPDTSSMPPCLVPASTGPLSLADDGHKHVLRVGA